MLLHLAEKMHITLALGELLFNVSFQLIDDNYEKRMNKRLIMTFRSFKFLLTLYNFDKKL